MTGSLAELSWPDAPKIIVTPPGPKAKEIMKRDKEKVGSQIYLYPGTTPMVWESARGATVKDVDGNIYIDLTGGWHAASTGHCHPRVVQSIQEQIGKLINAAGWATELRYKAAEKMVSVCPSPLEKCIFGTTGTDAVELGIKMARRFTKKHDIISLHTHFHGRGYAAGAASGARCINKDFGPYPSGFLYAPSPYCYYCSFKQEYPDCGLLCVDYLEDVINHESDYDVAAVILETWARDGGTPKGYLSKLKKLCEKHGILLIADEITCGTGRTGKWWYCDHENVVPDILLAAKGITSAFPGSVVVSRSELIDKMPPSCFTTSYSTNPISFAAMIATIDVMKEEKIVENAAKVGDYISKRLHEMQEEHELIGFVNSKGMEIYIEFVSDRKTKKKAMLEMARILRIAYERGILTYGSGWFTPPNVLTHEQAEKALNIIEDATKEVEKK